MLPTHQLEELLTLVSALDRPTLLRQFQSYKATFPVDFTPQFLDAQPTERLQHIFVAMCLQCQRLPEFA
jgi:hypothetical protein